MNLAGKGKKKARDVRIDRRGLLLGDAHLPLLAGTMHYWRNDPKAWPDALRAMRELGFRIVDLYIPWSVHETGKDRFDFGHESPEKDVAAFLHVAQEQGLYAIARPGPHINAEMTGFGLPDRILWRRGCQARDPHGKPVFLPAPPQGFPVPSYASDTFFKQASKFLRVVAELLAPLQYPNGPVVLIQVDNEGAYYFRDAAYDQDYHPDAISLYRRFLAKKYGPTASPRSIYGVGGASLHALEPPRRFDATSIDQLAYHLDWAEFQEHVVNRFFRRTAKRLRKAGLRSTPTSHNIPIAEHTSVLGQGSVQHNVDIVGLDYYYLAGPKTRRTIARRTSELAVRGDTHDRPSFACELGAGYPPFMSPLTPPDNAFTVLCALAYGLRGYNAYMAVERDRWIGAPIDPRGKPRHSSAFWKSLNAALERVSFAALRREMPVRIVTPRGSIRLKRVLNAFGPASGAAFAVMGHPASAHCRDDDFATGQPLAWIAERFVDIVERELERRGISFAHVGDDDPEACIRDARWVIVAAPAGLVEPSLVEMLAVYAQQGGRVSFGPEAPSRTPALRPLPAEPAFEYSRIELDSSAVCNAIDACGDVARIVVTPEDTFATLHLDDNGAPRVLFVIRPGEGDVSATIRLDGSGSATDLLTGDEVSWSDGKIAVNVPAKSVRMIELSQG